MVFGWWFGGLRNCRRLVDRKEPLPNPPRKWPQVGGGKKKEGFWVLVSSCSVIAPNRRKAGGGGIHSATADLQHGGADVPPRLGLWFVWGAFTRVLRRLAIECRRFAAGESTG